MPLTQLITQFTPEARRREVPHGQGVITYDQSNAMHLQVQGIQSAPDPIRQGDTPSRAARHQIAIMSTRPGDWKSGFADGFLTDVVSVHAGVRRLQNAGRQLAVRSQEGNLGVRPNITRPPAMSYGSLFSLGSQTYDVA